MTKEVLLHGMDLDDIKNIVDKIKPCTFGHTIEVRNGAPIEIDAETTFVSTTVIPVKFKGRYSETHVARIEKEIRDVDTRDGFFELQEKVKTMRPEIWDCVSDTCKKIFSEKEISVFTKNPIHSVKKKSRPPTKVDGDRPYITYCMNGSVQITCLAALQWNAHSKAFKSARHRYYLIENDEVTEIFADSAEERETIKEAVKVARLTIGKGLASRPTGIYKPTIANIVDIK